MKAGRNDPCPCGSGKKFKKCCLSKAPSGSIPLPNAERATPAPLPPASMRPPSRAHSPAPSAVAIPAKTLPPPDPAREKRDTRWKEFEAQQGEGRIAVFLRTLDDPELITDEMAFEMLSQMHQDADEPAARARFAELVSALADRQPEVYRQSCFYYLSWRLQDALANDAPTLHPLALELAAQAGRDIDIVNRSLRRLAYHGRLTTVVEAMRVAWPFVQSSTNVVPWGISEFAETGVNYEIYNYLEHTASPDPHDAGLLERIEFFIPDPDLNHVHDFVRDVAGQAVPDWTVDDFALKPAGKKHRDEWDDDEPVRKEADPGAQKLYRLVSQFVGYLRREAGVSYAKAELVRKELFSHFIRRHQGDLSPRLSMLEQAMHPGKKLPPPPKPGHPLCPERVTFEVHLAQLLGFMSGQYHAAAALFEIVPAWLRFLESRGLIDADRHARTLEELRPLHAGLLHVIQTYRDDPALHHSLETWPTPPEVTPARATLSATNVATAL